MKLAIPLQSNDIKCDHTNLRWQLWQSQLLWLGQSCVVMWSSFATSCQLPQWFCLLEAGSEGGKWWTRDLWETLLCNNCKLFSSCLNHDQVATVITRKIVVSPPVFSTLVTLNSSEWVVVQLEQSVLRLLEREEFF